MKLGVCLAALAFLAAPALGQAPGFEAQLSGKEVPTTIVLKDLDSTWKHIAITAPEGPFGGMGDMMKNMLPLALMGSAGKAGSKDDLMGMAFLSSMFGGAQKGTVYYTRGQTITVGGETFLIAYKYDAPGMDFMKLMMESRANGGKEPDFARLSAESKLKPESPLTLTLVNVRTIGSMGSVRPFDLQKELAEANAGNLMDWFIIAGQPHAQPAAPVVETHPAPAKPARKTGK